MNFWLDPGTARQDRRARSWLVTSGLLVECGADCADADTRRGVRKSEVTGLSGELVKTSTTSYRKRSKPEA
jgi:hypothetical protein